MSTIIIDSAFCNFGEENSKWAILTHEGVEMGATLKHAVLSLDISKTRGANWHGELRYSPFPVKADNTIQIKDVRLTKN